MTARLTLSATDNALTLSADNQTLALDVPSSPVLTLGVPTVTAGENNTGANVGGGAGVFRDKVGVTLNLRSLVGASGVTVTELADTVEVSTVWNEDEFTPTAGQVTFILSAPPKDQASIQFFVNGVLTDDVVDYTVSGQTITWLNTHYSMEITDKVIVRYL